MECHVSGEPEGETLQADWRRGQGPSAAQTPGLGEHIQESLFQSLLHNVSGSAQAGGHPRTQKPRNHTALRREGAPVESVQSSSIESALCGFKLTRCMYYDKTHAETRPLLKQDT